MTSASTALDGFIDELEEELRDFLTSEEDRVRKERDFLLAVLHGRTDGVTVEDVSTKLTEVYLSGYLSQYVEIEDDSGLSPG